MKAKNVIEFQGSKLLYCIGDDVKSATTCKKVEADGNLYEVEKYSVSSSFTGQIGMLLQLNDLDCVEKLLNKTITIVQ